MRKIELLVFYAMFLILLGGSIAYYPLWVLVFLGAFLVLLFFVKNEESALFFVIFSLPFSFALNPSEDIDLAVNRVLILALFGVWFLNSIVRKKIEIPFVPQSLFLAAFLFLATASVFVAQNDMWALRKLLVFLSIFPLYLVVANLCKEWQNIKKVLVFTLFSAVMVSLIGLVQFFSQFVLGIKPVFMFWSQYIAPTFYGQNFGKTVVENPSWLVNIGGETYLRALSLFPDPHMFAFYLGLVIPVFFSISLFVLNKRFAVSSDNNMAKGTGLLENPLFLFTSLVILLLTSVLTYSRSGYIGIIAGIAVVAVLSWKFLAPRLSSGIGIVAIVVLLSLFVTNNPFSARLSSITDLEEGSNAGRIKIWREALGIIEDNPLLGVGIGNYSLVIEPTLGYRNSIYAHNTYLDIASEMGIMAMIMWVLALFFGIKSSLNAFWKDKNNKYLSFEKAVSAGIFGSIAAFAISSLADTALYSPTVLAMFMVILGLSAAIAKDKYRR